MKCKICGRKITWDNSYGRRDFLICHPCMEKLRVDYNWGWDALEFIFDIGRIIEEKELTNE